MIGYPIDASGTSTSCTVNFVVNFVPHLPRERQAPNFENKVAQEEEESADMSKLAWNFTLGHVWL